VNKVDDYAALISKLTKTIDEQKNVIEKLRGQIDIQNEMKIPLLVAVQFAELTNKVDKLERQIEIYENYVPRKIVEQEQNKNRTRRGLSKNLKTTK
jgi:hypothetical protein